MNNIWFLIIILILFAIAMFPIVYKEYADYRAWLRKQRNFNPNFKTKLTYLVDAVCKDE